MTVKTDIILPGSPRAFRSEPDRPRLYSNTSSGVVCVVGTDKLEVTARYPIKMAGGNYALALDPANHRVFVGCRREPKLVVLDSETGLEITSLDILGDVDDLSYDAKRKWIYGSCGEGFLVVIQQNDADHYTQLAKMPTAKLARTSLFDPDSSRFLGRAATERQGWARDPRVSGSAVIAFLLA
jgi:hypothetical protein